MSINLALRFEQSESVAQQIRYARIDNTINPIYTTVSPNPTSSPAIVATNIPAGQYVLEVTGIFTDLRVCPPTYIYTEPCEGLISINAYITSDNLVVEYLAPSNAPKVRITVAYPNGGSFVANYTNSGSNIVIPFPSNVYGDFAVSGQSVCDEDSGFYSAASSQVIVTRVSSNTSITNNVNGISITSVSGVTGFTLPAIVTVGNTQVGSHTAFFGVVSATFTGTPGVTSSATLSLNGTVIQCVAVPSTSGGTVTFTSASFSDTDVLAIIFNNGTCV